MGCKQNKGKQNLSGGDRHNTLESEAYRMGSRNCSLCLFLGLQRRTISIKRRDASDVCVLMQYRIRTIAGSTDTVEPDPKFSFFNRGETGSI